MTLHDRADASDEPAVAFALGAIRSGGMLGAASNPACSAQLQDLAATLPEVFGTVDPSLLSRVAARLCAEATADGFVEVLLLSEHRVHVMRPLTTRPDVAIVGTSRATHRIGLVLSKLHERAAEVEGNS